MRRVVIAVCAGLLFAPAPCFAQAGWFELAVPGSLERILEPGIVQPAGPRLLRDLMGVFHDVDSAAANRTAAGAFRGCLTELHRLRTLWSAVDRTAGEVSLRAATGQEDGRRALEAFLDLFEQRLERESSTYRVTAREEEPRAICAAGSDWRSDAVQRRLNAGESLAWDLPHFVVSLPLSPRFWLELLYDERIETEAEAAALASEMAADLTGRLVTDARAAQFYLGLAALDDRTLNWLIERPRILLRLNAARLSMFARFGGGLLVHDGEVQVPGGAGAVPFWERLVGASPTEPERFVDRLFTRSSGRVAQAYHLVSRLPERQQRFVLGSWRADARDRRRGQATLQRVLESLPPPDPVFANPSAAPLADVAADARRPLGETICGVPPDEAIALTWDLLSQRGMNINVGSSPPNFACGPRVCTVSGRRNELFALEAVGVDATQEGFRYSCQVQARMNFLADFESIFPELSTFDVMQIRFTARMYRLGYKLGPNMLELREFIDSGPP